MLEQKPSHEVEGMSRRVLRQDCVETALGKVKEKDCLQH
jgi:hypothetical protein